MNPELLFMIVLTGLIGLAAYAVGRLIFTACRVPHNAIYVAVAPALGLTTLAVQLWLYGLIHIPWHAATLFLPWLIAAFLLRKRVLAALAFEKRLPKQVVAAYKDMDWLGRMLLITTTVFALACLVSLIVEPFMTSDILAMWGYKAKEFFTHGQVFVNQYINSSLGSARFYHVDYPPLWPLMSDVGYVFVGQVNETIFKAIQFIFVVSGATSLFVFVRSRVSTNATTIAAIAAMLFVAAPQFLPMLMNLQYMGYADYVLCVTMLLATIFAVRSLGKPGGIDWWLALTLAGAAGVIKNEGLPFVAIIFVVIGGTYLVRLLKNRKTIAWRPVLATGIGAALLLVPFGLWQFYKLKHNIVSDFSLQNLIDSGMAPLDRLHTIFKYIWLYLSTNPMYIWEGMAIVLAIACTMWRRSKATLLVGFVVIVQLSSYVGSYMLSPYELKFHILSSIDRLSTQVLPLVVLWLALLIADSAPAKGLRNKAAKNR